MAMTRAEAAQGYYIVETPGLTVWDRYSDRATATRMVAHYRAMHPGQTFEVQSVSLWLAKMRAQRTDLTPRAVDAMFGPGAASTEEQTP